MEEITKAATAFRAAIEQTPAAKLPVTLQRFPHGACGDATVFLGYYLKTHGFGTFEYVLGMGVDDEGDRYSHAWLRQGKIVVDITADQFQDKAPVIVAEESPWHDGFDTEIPHEADFHIFDRYIVASLSSAYKAIAANLKDAGAG